MVNKLAAVTSATLRNGETVYVNDHVYVSPPWSDRDSTPYTVCRIIEFLPASTSPRKGQKLPELQVRLSLYYRPSDISGRNVSDFRLLMAAIHTDTQPLANVRGKCYVRHKDRIDDLIKWKKLPDHFYFVKYFDPYIKREFEVIRTETVNNIPTHIKDVLLERYEYLLTEREMVADLTDNFRTCCVCETWASSQESVRCEACKNNYHMTCLNPPLLAKPAKGYSWICLPCTMQRHKDVQDKKYLYQPNVTAPKPKAPGKKKDKAAVNSNRPDRTHRGWPWRYFGLYTNAEDALDPDDLIFPRAATRTGIKFQANVLSWEEQQAAEERHRLGESESGPSRHIAMERGHDVGEKNHDSTIDVWSVPSDELVSYMDEVNAMSLDTPPYDLARINMALRLYKSFGREAALSKMRNSRPADFDPIIFSEYDTSTFEDQLERNGGLDTQETGKLLEKRPSTVLRYSYIWKNKQLKAENEAIRQHRKVNTAHARQNKTLGAPSLGRIRAREGSEDSEAAEGSLFGDEIKETKKAQCAACSTRVSSVWWRAPRSIPGDAMCENCGADYRKYGVISFTKSEDSKKPEKIENKAKKQKLGDTSASATPVPVPPKLPPCSWCRKMEPKGCMARCKTCTFSVHSMCYGIEPQNMGADWECDLCANTHLEEAHIHPRCVLCPQDASIVSIKAKKRPPADFDVLSCMKVTEGRQWAHVLCASWTPEVQFTNVAALKTIENISSVALERWKGVCTLCGQQDGAVTGCTDCGLLYHPSCAWTVGCKFGFEFSLAKPGKKEVVTIAKFREDAGVMMPGIWCKGHELEGRVIYDMNDVDPEQNETALQIYTASYKAIPQDESFALLRKATRLDQHIIQAQPVNNAVKICTDCGIDVSPKWHEGVKNEGIEAHGHLCHQCWHRS